MIKEPQQLGAFVETAVNKILKANAGYHQATTTFDGKNFLTTVYFDAYFDAKTINVKIGVLDNEAG